VEAVAPFDFKHPSDARTNAAPPETDTLPYKCGKPLPPYTTKNLSNISHTTKEESSDDGKSSQQFVSKPQGSPKSRSGNIFSSDAAKQCAENTFFGNPSPPTMFNFRGNKLSQTRSTDTSKEISNDGKSKPRSRDSFFADGFAMQNTQDSFFGNPSAPTIFSLSAKALSQTTSTKPKKPLLGLGRLSMRNRN
jgi:hypothetical protein